MEYHLKYRVRYRYTIREKDSIFNEREVVFDAENETNAIAVAQERWNKLEKLHDHQELKFAELVTGSHPVPWMPT